MQEQLKNIKENVINKKMSEILKKKNETKALKRIK